MSGQNVVGLVQCFKVKQNARVMSTVNVGIEDRLVNGQLVTGRRLLVVNKGNFEKIYFDLVNEKAAWKKESLLGIDMGFLLKNMKFM